MRLFTALAAVFAAAAPATADAETDPRTAYDFEFTSITGEAMPLSAYEGQALLVVNTASRCGFTGQYDGLQALWTEFQDQGLVVIGVPSDQFNQELDSEEEVREFCEMRFDLDFPMTSITPVRGDDAHPFYAWTHARLGGAGRPGWNFHKILIGRDGQPIDGWGPRTGPNADRLRGAIETALAASADSDADASTSADETAG